MIENDLTQEPELELEYLEEARKNEQTHLDTLKEVLGDQAPTDVQPTFPDGTFDSAESAAKTGVALETAFVGTYLGAIGAFESADLRAAAAQIAGNEAQHLSVFSDFANDNPISLEALPKTVSADEAKKTLQPFLR